MAAREIAPDVFYLPLSIANAYLVGRPGAAWVLIDTGLSGDAAKILRAAAWLHGAGSKPTAILLTHGHPDHAGSALELAARWNVPVWAHVLELPYLRGEAQYPPFDPTVGGFMGLLGRFFRPSQAILGQRVAALPAECASAGLTGWQWAHTPGHSPGHVVFFRPKDGVLLAGDAITTVNLNSFLASAAKFPRVSGPPATATYDWGAAADSVKRLVQLQPLTIACGHGRPMSGSQAVKQLAELATDFPLPAHGRYVPEPAMVGIHGVVSLPPQPADPFAGTALALGALAAAAGLLTVAALRRKNQRSLTKGDTPAQAL